MSDPAAYVHIDLSGLARPVGRLWAFHDRGRPRASFEFDSRWLEDPLHYALGPALPAATGPFHTDRGRALFGALGDSAPDSWGRKLITRNEARQAKAESTPPRTLGEIDFLLGVTDEVRQGALRFSITPDGPFVAPKGDAHVPPLVELPSLLKAANTLANDPDSVAADDAVLLLLAPGSSLGGARAKASVRDHDGALAIAKFPQSGDDIDVISWEKAMLLMASQSGINVADSRLETVGDSKVLILQRFDRRGVERIPFLSALSLLDATDGDQGSYVEMFDALRRVASQPKHDARELWTRLAFNILASNFDDHLRNHAVLYDGHGWTLSPAYDLNPVPAQVKPRDLTTAINVDGDTTASLDLALEAAREFLLTPGEARRIAGRIARVTKTWRSAASQIGLRVDEIDAMSSAFEHEELDRALRW